MHFTTFLQIFQRVLYFIHINSKQFWTAIFDFATMGDHEGWNSELFVDPVDEEYMCGICSEVLEDAIETP
eukprot:g55497.t1